MERREFLRMGAGLGLVAFGCSPKPEGGAGASATPAQSPLAETPATPAAAQEAEFIVRNSRPLNLETPVDRLGDAITPADVLFVRSHHPAPDVEVAGWNLKVSGLVKKTLNLSLAELQNLPSRSVTAVLQCAGNGRAFFKPAVPGVPWAKGAVGNGRWEGVSLKTVLEQAGLKPEAAWVVLRGADQPVLATTPHFVRALTLEKAMDPDTLLAYNLNGGPLPKLHGFPVRVVCPGWVADDWLKWVTSIEVTAAEPDEFYFKTAYRLDGQPMTEMPVKSLLLAPLEAAQVKSGEATEVRGVAWTGGKAVIEKVEVELEGAWQEAEFLDKPEPYAWRRFKLSWTPKGTGATTIRSRATDSRGQTQPLEPTAYNPSGYLWNQADSVEVTLT